MHFSDWERTSQHPINTRDAAVAALSDAQFVAPLVHTGDMLASPANQLGQEKVGPKTFFYVFDYQTKDGDYPQVNTRLFSDDFSDAILNFNSFQTANGNSSWRRITICIRSPIS